MFKNLWQAYPDVKFYLLINKLTNDEHHVTIEQLNKMYGEERVLKMFNNSDPHWIIVDPN